ncbi:MAG: TetR/AcrR family transcriptional regulator [Bacilli bacterium]|nr:TetR/AcrR family transcriptional regulator [Bacilli bacterium]
MERLMKTEHNRNYQRIDNAITNAYNILLTKKGTPDVSITELCECAKVNRTTFYKHYKGIHEITDRLENELIYKLFNIEYSDKISVEDFLSNPRPALEKLNKNITDNYEYYKRVFRPDRLRFITEKTINLLVDDFKKHYPNLAKKDAVMKKVRINICNFIGSVTTLYVHWLNGYLDCDIKDISEHVSTVITHVYKGVKIPE